MGLSWALRRTGLRVTVTFKCKVHTTWGALLFADLPVLEPQLSKARPTSTQVTRRPSSGDLCPFIHRCPGAALTPSVAAIATRVQEE